MIYWLTMFSTLTYYKEQGYYDRHVVLITAGDVSSFAEDTIQYYRRAKLRRFSSINRRSSS
jgi:hypothetical protein